MSSGASALKWAAQQSAQAWPCVVLAHIPISEEASALGGLSGVPASHSEGGSSEHFPATSQWRLPLAVVPHEVPHGSPSQGLSPLLDPPDAVAPPSPPPADPPTPVPPPDPLIPPVPVAPPDPRIPPVPADPPTPVAPLDP